MHNIHRFLSVCDEFYTLTKWDVTCECFFCFFFVWVFFGSFLGCCLFCFPGTYAFGLLGGDVIVWLILRGCKAQQDLPVSIQAAAHESGLMLESADCMQRVDELALHACLVKGFALIWHVSLSSVNRPIHSADSGTDAWGNRARLDVSDGCFCTGCLYYTRCPLCRCVELLTQKWLFNTVPQLHSSWASLSHYHSITLFFLLFFPPSSSSAFTLSHVPPAPLPPSSASLISFGHHLTITFSLPFNFNSRRPLLLLPSASPFLFLSQTVGCVIVQWRQTDRVTTEVVWTG